jgi:hypothetical protein
LSIFQTNKFDSKIIELFRNKSELPEKVIWPGSKTYVEITQLFRNGTLFRYIPNEHNKESRKRRTNGKLNGHPKGRGKKTKN